jgi:hypothetical protein
LCEVSVFRPVTVLCTAFLITVRGTEELGHAVQLLRTGLQGSQLLLEDVTPSLISSCCYTRDSPPVDLLVRTSGEHRLSDFLLWQCRYAMLHWVPCLWPELSYADFLECLLAWQRNSLALQRLKALGGAAAEAAAAGDIVEGAGSSTCFGGGAGRGDEFGDVTSSGSSSSSSSSSVNGMNGGGGSAAWYSSGSEQDKASNSSIGSLPAGKGWQSWLAWGGGCSSSAAGCPLESAGSKSLSAISEGCACCCPHPNQGLRLEGFLRDVTAADQRWLEQKAAV